MAETQKKGIVYLMTNKLFAKEGFHKVGFTANPFERLKIQRNSTPPAYPFYYEAVIFSVSYKDIEKELKAIFKNKGWLINNNGVNGGCEWLHNVNVADIVSEYEKIISHYNGSKICSNGKCFGWKNDELTETERMPKCNMQLLGIKDGDKIKLTKKAQELMNFKGTNEFIVSGNKIIVEGEIEGISVSNYIKSQIKRVGKSNEHNGFEYFTFDGNVIADMWRTLVSTHL